MRLLVRALLLLLATSSGPAAPASDGMQIQQPARVRWIVDLKKDFGFEGFQRVKSGKRWKAEQGIAFLTPDEVVVYQVKPGSAVPADVTGGGPAAFYLQAEIFDAQDGHEIKRLVLPASSEPGKIMPLRQGAFLVQSADNLYLYSNKFEQVASRKLALNSAVQRQEWQIDVSPSRTRIVAAHQQAWQETNDKKKGMDSKAEIEILDPESLKTTKAFTVPYLDAWSAEDNDIITVDPEGDTGNRDFGVLDFNGTWRELRTSAEGDDPDCPYEMRAMEHRLIAAHDCDELVVVSASGNQQLSLPVRGDGFLISMASAGRFLAEAMVQPATSRVVVEVFDITRKAQVAWITLERNDVYYAVSPAGTLALVDGEKLKFFAPTEINDKSTQSSEQRWIVELVNDYHYETFDRDTSLTWMRQQDVRFITADEIAVYQVMKAEQQATLAERDPSGGAGNFYLQVELFSTHDGHEIKSMRLPTNSQFSKVIPTHDGKFIVRTGDVLYLYSADCNQLASRKLPLEQTGGAEGWQVSVAPSGVSIVLAHQHRLTDGPVQVRRASMDERADVELLNADTLETTKKFSVTFLPDNWSAGDEFLVTGDHKSGVNSFEVVDFGGKRRELKARWEQFNQGCFLQTQALPERQVAGLGCGAFVVVSAGGATIFSAGLTSLERSVAAAGAGPFVAMEIDKLQAWRPLSDARPQRIDVYDLKTKAKTISLELQSGNPYFDVSSTGELAVVENDHLSLYFSKPN